MDINKKESKKSVKLTPEAHSAFKFWVKDIEGDGVSEATGIHKNTIYRVSLVGQGNPKTIETILKKMPEKYMKVAEVMGMGATA